MLQRTSRGTPVRPRSGAGRAARSLLAAASLALAACTTPTAAPPAPPTGAYKVGPPDVLRVSILPEPRIESELTVRPDGRISVDLIGDVQAAGRTTGEIASAIEERIARYKRDASVTVAVAESQSDQITVLGEVNRPSTFALDRETRVSEALGRVAGPTVFAAAGRIRVIRSSGGETRVFRVDLDDISEGDLSSNLMLQGGDIVYVPPTVSTSIGNAIRVIFYPLQQVLGLGGGTTATRVFTGGL